MKNLKLLLVASVAPLLFSNSVFADEVCNKLNVTSQEGVTTCEGLKVHSHSECGDYVALGTKTIKNNCVPDTSKEYACKTGNPCIYGWL